MKGPGANMRSARFAAALAGVALAFPAAAAMTGPAGGGAAVSNYQASVPMTQLFVDQGIYPTAGGTGGVLDYMGMVRTFAGDHAVAGLPTARGQMINPNDNNPLFGIIGTAYGGDGATSFALPDLRGRSIVGAKSAYFSDIGQASGAASTALTLANLPAHDHGLPGGGATGVTGSGLAFDNRQPQLPMTYLIDPYASPGISAPFVGAIAAFAGDFRPGLWLPANGQVLKISNFQDLYHVIGTTYGGDGVTTFALPDLQGRLAVGAGAGFALGQTGGETQVSLTLDQLPSHSHTLPGGGLSDPAGGGAPFDNMQPYLALNYLINIGGIAPCQASFPACDINFSAFQGEVTLYAGGAIPDGWALANGQLLSISQHADLFAALGTRYGGDGINTFALPDLRGRTIVGSGDGFAVGQAFGDNFPTLTEAQMPTHRHEAPGIPEPATWASMILGFALAGSGLRRRAVRLA